MNFRSKFRSVVGICITVALGVSAQTLPTFQTFSSATGSTSANVIIPQKPTSQVRVVSVVAQSDLASSAVNFYSGSTARYIGQANTNQASTVVLLDSTNGLAANALLYVQGQTSNVVGTVSSWTTTN